MQISLVMTALVLLLASGVSLGQQAETGGEEGMRRVSPWGDGPPPWVKDGKVDEEARKAFFAKRAAAGNVAGGMTSPGQRPPENATPEERKAFWQQRAAERAAAESGVAERPAGQGGSRPPASANSTNSTNLTNEHAGHGGPMTNPGASADASVPAGAARWGSGARGGGGRGVGVLWLSDAAPFKRDGKGGSRHGSGGKPSGSGSGMGGMGRMGEVGKDGVPIKRVWLNTGSNPKTARPATAEESALVQGPDGKTSEIVVDPHGGPYNVKVPTPAQGCYNVYFSRRALEQDTLNVTLAKAEVVSASMGHSMPKDEAARLVMPRTDARIPVEIVRERKDKETLFTRLNYGDEIVFQVLQAGKPVQNARVTFTSGQGWSNSVQSDEDGRAAFTLIRDYYPDDWSLFDKRHRENYLVSASFTTPEAGEYQGGKYASSRYSVTLSGAYYPGMADYESYSSGLMVGTAGLLFTGSSVWLYRRRRVKPYKEVRFDE